MTPDGFRKVALALPEAVEASHMDHPDFRVRKKIFATLGYPDAAWGMVSLTPADQQALVKDDPAVFVPVKGKWGERGATQVRLKAVDRPTLERAMRLAWQRVAPASLRQS